MTPSKRLSIILPSYNDARIADAIRSVRRFDDIGAVRLVVVDGGSKQEVRDAIEGLLAPDDIYVSEPDRGIFDALNKGLELCDTDFIGWLGSDDIFTCQLRAAAVIEALESTDLLVASCGVMRGDRIRRISHALPSRLGLVKLGLHNPHFSTFGRASLLKSDRFELDVRGADIPYFIRIFENKPRVASTPAVATLMNEGGFSTQSYRRMLKMNLELVAIYRRHTNAVIAPLAVCVKLSYKAWCILYYKLFQVNRSSLERSTLE